MPQKSLNITLIISLFGLTLISLGCDKLKTDRAQQSYTVGYALGQQLAPVKDDIDADIVALGLKDGIKKDSKLSEEVMAKRLAELQSKQRDRAALSAADTLKASLAYIETTAKKPGIKVIEEGILVEEIKAGAGQPRALKDDDEVLLKYVAKRVDGSVFDQTSDANGIKVRLKDLILPGLKKAVRKMPEGAEWTVHLAPEQAYGMATRPGVPSQSALVYEVTMMKLTKKK